ncbi:hypothetical protein ACOSP7_032428 [Xanthoceras sorbifolium]
MTFMSDRQKGVLKAITTQWPSAKTRLCFLIKKFFSTNKDARIWLDKIDPAYWSKHAFDSSVKCDHVTNNMTESFNSMLG